MRVTCRASRIVLAGVALAAFTGCIDLLAPGPPGGSITAWNLTTGGTFDLDGFLITLDGTTSKTVDLNARMVFEGVRDGWHEIALSGLSSNCAVIDGATKSVRVVEGSPVDVSFNVTCTSPPELATIRILFARGDGGGNGSHPSALVAMNADGSGRTQLTSGAFTDYGPDLSPDGRTIAFMRDDPRGAGLEPGIFSRSVEGAEVPLIAASAYDPDWSPDGTRIAFIGPVGHWGGQVFVARVDGDGGTRLTGQDLDLEEASPAWSPDGSRLAFNRVKLGPSGASDLGVWVMRSDGSDARPLRHAGWQPVWSPDGRKIALADYARASGVHAVKLVEVDGSGAVTLLEQTGSSRLVVDDWSADGRYLLFSRSPLGYPRSDVYLLDTRTGATVRLTADGAYNKDAVFWRVR